MPQTPPTRAAHGGDSFHAIGVDFENLENAEDVIGADILDAWYDPSPKVIQGLQSHLPWLVKTSPPTHGEGLIAAIAKARGLDPENILTGGGSSALIYSVMPQLARPGAKVVILDPMYGEYIHIVQHVLGIQPKSIGLSANDHFIPQKDAVVEAVRDADMVIWVNPNSPTGVAVSREFLRQTLDAMPTTATLWVDETYIDFVGGDASVERWAADDSRVIVSKSMSKVYGLSGLRVGYLVAHASRIREFERFNPPWSVGLLAQYAAVLALQDGDYYADQIRKTHELREELAAQIELIPWVERIVPSAANFFLFEVKGVSAGEIVERARAENLFLRDCRSWGDAFGERFVRIAVKSEGINRRMIEILGSLEV